MRWGMPPSPCTGATSPTSATPHWRMWLKPENRCFVPNGFAEYAPDINPVMKKKDVVWRSTTFSDNRTSSATWGDLHAYAEIAVLGILEPSLIRNATRQDIRLGGIVLL